MEEKYNVTTSQSWFSRLGDAFRGILVGLLLLAASAALLWWNEGRAITTARALAEGSRLVVSVPADRVDPANEGKLVHVSGPARAGSALTDPDFPFMSVKALVLQRTTEMFQWQEEQQSKEVKKVGGSVEKQTTYSYRKVWSSSLRDSSRFRESQSHANPSSMSYASFRQKAPDARLGAFRLPASLLDLPAPEALRPPENAQLSGNLSISGGQIYIGKNPDAPEIGDLRIRHTYAPEQDVSVVARQAGDGFGAFTIGNGKRSIQMLKPGLLDAAGMFGAAQSENSLLTWLLRGVGTLCMCAGLFLMLRPLSVAGDVVPFIGDILGFGAGLAAFCVGLACSLAVIAVAWFFYRPLLSALLLAAAVAALVGMRLLAGRSGKQAAPPPVQS